MATRKKPKTAQMDEPIRPMQDGDMNPPQNPSVAPQNAQNGQIPNEMQNVPASMAIADIKPIGDEEISKALFTLKKYMDGKQYLDQRILNNENWWKLRHWGNAMDKYGEKTDERPTSAWLFNCVINKHAEAVDAYPTFSCLPREAGDRQEAQSLSDILPVVLAQNDFEQVYSEEAWSKLKSGTGCYAVTWDTKKLNGLGDISIRNVPITNLYWEAGCTDIQKSRNVFLITQVDTEVLEDAFPELQGKLGGNSLSVRQAKDIESQQDDTTKTYVIDWYYKKPQNGKMMLHYCQFCDGHLLFASENEPDKYPEGWYAHGLYPFVFDTLFPIEGSLCGFGYIDVCREPQKYVDLMNQAITKNALIGATPRYFVRNDGGVNEEEFADITKPFVHVNNLSDDSIRKIDHNGLDGIYVTYLNNKIEEMKETSGNRDVATGGTTSGVTAASAISAMMEASGKTSRDSTKTAYRAYKQVVNLCIELIRQFYDMPRQFRILGANGQEMFINYTNDGIRPQSLGTDLAGNDFGMRLPVFDIEVVAMQESAYTKLSQNELALQFFQLGFFNAQMAEQALMCLDMMEFKGKNDVVQKIQNNSMLMQNLQMMSSLALSLAQQYRPELVPGLQNAMMQMGQVIPQGGGEPNLNGDQNGDGKQEGKLIEKSKAEARDSHMPQ